VALAGAPGDATVIGRTRESGVVEDDLSDIPAEELDSDAPVGGRDRQWDVTAAVMIGGVLGAEARYGLSVAAPHASAGFPWSTVYTNIIGCFCLGILMSLLNQLSSPHRLVRPLLGIGVLGGFTTFSTFTVDAERLIEHHRAGIAGLYVLCTLATAAAAVAAATIAAQLAARSVYRRRLRRDDTTRSRHRDRTSELSRGRR
jgi:CrcB protein